MRPLSFFCEGCKAVPSARVLVGGRHTARIFIQDGQLKIRSPKIRDRISLSIQDGSLEATCLRCNGVVVLVERSEISPADIAPPPLEEGADSVDLVPPPEASTDAVSFLSGLGLDPAKFRI